MCLHASRSERRAGSFLAVSLMLRYLTLHSTRELHVGNLGAAKAYP